MPLPWQKNLAENDLSENQSTNFDMMYLSL